MFFNDNYHYFKKISPPTGGDGGKREGVVVVEKGQF